MHFFLKCFFIYYRLSSYIRILKFRTMLQPKKINYKTYCFQHQNNILFFYYNSNHPIHMKNIKFELGKVKIFHHNNQLYTCQLTSNPHLNFVLDWNQEYFAKLFHGLSLFELEKNEDEHDDTVSLVVKDHFEKDQSIFLMRAKLNLELGFDLTKELWVTFQKFNAEKIKDIQTLTKENSQLRIKADSDLTQLINLQQAKLQEKNRLKGQLSVILSEKEAKLKEYSEKFEYFSFTKESEPSLDFTEQRESLSIAGSLFQESQADHFNHYDE